jgi:hypothetical protein
LSGVRRWILSFATSPHSASHGNVVYTSIDEPDFRLAIVKPATVIAWRSAMTVAQKNNAP